MVLIGKLRYKFMFAMKKIVLFASAALCAGSMAFAAPLQSQQDKESYSMGASVGNYLSDQIFKQSELGASINMDLVVQGFEEALRNKSQLSDDDVLKFLNSRAEKLNKLYDAQKKKIAAENSAKAKDFLAKNAKKKGVKVTKSGLQYEVLKKGTGEKPKTEDVVTVDYVGTLIDGTVFESTYETKEPARFVLMTVIPGLEECVRLMDQGSRYRFTIPANLAYGADGAGQIPPESVLIFELELVKVEKVGAHKNFGEANLKGMTNPHQ